MHLSRFAGSAVLTAVFVIGIPTALLAHDGVHSPKSGREGMVVEPTAPLATDVPDRILVSWKNDPSTSFSVTWRSLAGADAVAEIAPATAGPEFLKHVMRFKGQTSELKTDLGPVHMHAATFDGLEPETTYVYRVGSRRTKPLSEESAKAQHESSVDYAWSAWTQVRTTATFNGRVAPTRFVYVGDAQNDVKSHWSRLVREAFRDAPRMTFFLHAGDLVNSGNKDHHWGQWFEAGDFIFSMVPQLAIPGNHEYDKDAFDVDDPESYQLTRRWGQRFEYPENGPQGTSENVFSIDVQGIRIIALDTNIKPELRDDHTLWLERQLQDNPNRWTIVTHHHPVYSTSSGRDNPALREQWQPLYEKYGVDLVLQGHDHSYGRSAPLLAHGDNVATGLRVAPDDEGPVYVVSVSGPKMYGLKEYEDGQKPFEKHIANEQLYQVIDIDHDKISYIAKTPDGQVRDQFQIVKDEKGSKAFHEAKVE
ncbi:MAG: metallophosphoesterase family protein [Planctomycetota bacterium]